MESEDICKIDVSGTLFKTRRSTLRKLGDCYFNQFGGTDILPEYFLDRSPLYFAHILDVIQTRQFGLAPIPVPSHLDESRVKMEFDFLGLSPSLDGHSNRVLSNSDVKLLLEAESRKSRMQLQASADAFMEAHSEHFERVSLAIDKALRAWLAGDGSESLSEGMQIYFFSRKNLDQLRATIEKYGRNYPKGESKDPVVNNCFGHPSTIICDDELYASLELVGEESGAYLGEKYGLSVAVSSRDILCFDWSRPTGWSSGIDLSTRERYGRSPPNPTLRDVEFLRTYEDGLYAHYAQGFDQIGFIKGFLAFWINTECVTYVKS
jgi:hypothetical protein